MKIECPECAFSRDVPKDRIPSHAVTATCPQCSCRFRFFDDEKRNAPATPLPHGAHIPHSEEPLYTQAHVDNERQENHVPKEAHHTMQDGATAHDTQSGNADANSQEPHFLAQEKQGNIFAQDEQKDDCEQAEENFSLENPWDYPHETGYLVSFYRTITDVMFTPQRFFAGIVPQKSHVHVLVFFVIISVVQLVVERFWGGVIASFVASTAINDPELQKLLSILTPHYNIFFSVLLGAAVATVKILVTSIFYFAFLKIVAPNNVHFSLIFQIVAYSSAPLLLCLVPALGSLVGFIWSMACTLIGCRYAMRLSWGQVILGIVPAYLIGVPMVMYFVLGA